MEDKKTNCDKDNCKWENFPEQTERKLSHRIRNWNRPCQCHFQAKIIPSTAISTRWIPVLIEFTWALFCRDVVKSLLCCLDNILGFDGVDNCNRHDGTVKFQVLSIKTTVVIRPFVVRLAAAWVGISGELIQTRRRRTIVFVHLTNDQIDGCLGRNFVTTGKLVITCRECRVDTRSEVLTNLLEGRALTT